MWWCGSNGGKPLMPTLSLLAPPPPRECAGEEPWRETVGLCNTETGLTRSPDLSEEDTGILTAPVRVSPVSRNTLWWLATSARVVPEVLQEWPEHSSASLCDQEEEEEWCTAIATALELALFENRLESPP